MVLLKWVVVVVEGEKNEDGEDGFGLHMVIVKM